MRQDDRAVLEVQDTGIGISQPDGHDGHISVRPWTATAPRSAFDLPLHRTAQVTA